MQTGKEYNIWYNKWAGGDREDSYSNKIKSQTRCNIKRDSGLTRANTTGMKYTCLFFARGCCPYGWECEYLHTLPDPEASLPDSSKDCFARDKFSDYRDDMGGVGSFNRQNRTLYIGRIKETGNAGDTETVVFRHLKEFGKIARDESPSTWAVKILQYRSVAFVTYEHECHAQFAKEAMACQSLDNDEILNVRWATEDPNPTAKVAEKRRLVDMGQEAIQAKMDPKMVEAMRSIRALEDGDDVQVEEIEMEDEEEERQSKRQRIDNGSSIEAPKANGILSVDALEGLKYFAEIQKRRGTVPVVSKAPPARAPAPAMALADYGSDSDQDE